MTANDYRQIYKTIERCNGELHGIVHRLNEAGDYVAADIVNGAINDLNIRLHELVALRNRAFEQMKARSGS